MGMEAWYRNMVRDLEGLEKYHQKESIRLGYHEDPSYDYTKADLAHARMVGILDALNIVRKYQPNEPSPIKQYLLIQVCNGDIRTTKCCDWETARRLMIEQLDGILQGRGAQAVRMETLADSIHLQMDGDRYDWKIECI